MRQLTIIILLIMIMLSGCTKEIIPEVEYSIKLDTNQVILNYGETRMLNLIVSPLIGKDVRPEWSTSDNSVVSVDSKGTITAKSLGEAQVIVTAYGKNDTCNVTVIPIDPETLTIDKSLEMFPGDTYKIQANITPTNALYNDQTWVSSNESIATVNQDGTVTALSAGEATVTVTIGNKVAECNIKIINGRNMQVGDILYLDGSYSAYYNPSKTPVGIVFWLGNPSTDDEILRSDCPECVNGLAVSLGEVETAWQKIYEYSIPVSQWIQDNLPEYVTTSSDTDDSILSKRLGYNNTKALLQYNEAPENSEWPIEIAESLIEYRKTNPLPENTSGWYIPSIMELSILCSGNEEELGAYSTDMRDIVDNTLKKIPSAKQFSLILYWSSTEWRIDNSWSSGFYDNYIGANNKKLYGNRVRFIFAF